uniref:Glycosyltransferase n=1 Tax=Sinningia cardinalis TaxID=189007 RepID=D7URL9_9LAMI|nr:glucosyltransferase [Sinningia cardinalis]
MEDTIVLYPAPGIGHLLSTVELGKLILRHHHFSTIHVLITTGFDDSPHTATYIDQISKTNPSITFHRLPFLPLNLSPTVSSIATLFEFIRLNATSVLHTLQKILQTSKVRALILDFFCTSAFPISESLGIPVYYFFTSGLAAVAAYLYFPTIDKQVDQSFKDLVDTKFHIPGLPPLPSRHMPQPVLNRNDPAYHDVLYFSHHLARSSGIIVNTFDGLEPIALKAITDGLCIPDIPTPPIYNIGPLIADADTKPADQNLKHHSLSWLDRQPNQSVVFLCFGSRGSFSTDQLKEIAKGLERSGQRFLWAVKKPPFDKNSKEVEELGEFNVMEIMPEGFLDRTKDRGMVVESWVPQVKVLEHPAVGGFVTHCGWNSVLEAVMAGVPMVAWPLYAEQHLNKAALVEDMKMAIPMDPREDDEFMFAEEVEKRIREVMDGEKSKELREQCHKMKNMAIGAWERLGSSTVALDKVVHVWFGN